MSTQNYIDRIEVSETAEAAIASFFIINNIEYICKYSQSSEVKKLGNASNQALITIENRLPDNKPLISQI